MLRALYDLPHRSAGSWSACGHQGGLRAARHPARAPRRDAAVRDPGGATSPAGARSGRGGGGAHAGSERVDHVPADRPSCAPPGHRRRCVAHFARSIGEIGSVVIVSGQHHRQDAHGAGLHLPARVTVQARASGGGGDGPVRDLVHPGAGHDRLAQPAEGGRLVSAPATTAITTAARRRHSRRAERRRRLVRGGLLAAVPRCTSRSCWSLPARGIVWTALKPGVERRRRRRSRRPTSGTPSTSPRSSR